MNPGKVMVATDNLGDGIQVMRQLRTQFAQVSLSTDAGRAVADFEECAPDVLVLAFDSLDKVQKYLDRYRLRRAAPRKLHRTVVLCSQGESQAAFERCKAGVFDDYVTYWPQVPDTLRLCMSVWIACNAMLATQSNALRPAELRAHVKRVAGLAAVFDDFETGAERSGGGREALAQAEHQIARVVDDFAERLALGVAAGWLAVKDRAALAQEIMQLKGDQIMLARGAGATATESMKAWAREVLAQIEPSLTENRALDKRLRQIRPVVLVVEDDEFARQLVGRCLDARAWETVFAADGAVALSLLSRLLPDVILMDIRLPGLDGVSLTQKLKSSAHLAQIPVIMMTGDATKQTLVSSLEAGAAAFVIKPFTRESLVKNLDKVLSR
jgi:CheY-like chemotaxis protein